MNMTCVNYFGSMLLFNDFGFSKTFENPNIEKLGIDDGGCDTGLNTTHQYRSFPVFLSHFFNLVFGSSPAAIYIHNLGRIPKKLLFGSGRTALSAVVLIIVSVLFYFICLIPI